MFFFTTNTFNLDSAFYFIDFRLLDLFLFPKWIFRVNSEQIGSIVNCQNNSDFAQHELPKCFHATGNEAVKNFLTTLNDVQNLSW